MDPGKAPTAVYESQSSGDFITQERLNSALNHAIMRQRLTASGVRPGNIDAVLKEVDIDTLQINKKGIEVKSNAMSSFWKGYVMAFLLSMTTMIYGMNVARSIIQEKTSRIFEVMLATAKPSDLLAGKLIGVGAVGLTQIAIWLVAGGAIAGAFAAQTISSDHLTAFFLDRRHLLRSLFPAGVSAVRIPVRRPCRFLRDGTGTADVHAAGRATHLAGFALIVVVINNPDSALSVAASLFPATAPIIMMLRMGSEIPPAGSLARPSGSCC